TPPVCCGKRTSMRGPAGFDVPPHAKTSLACRLHEGFHKKTDGDDGLAGGYYRISLLLLVITMLDTISAPLISTAVLVGSAQLLGVELDQPYVLLAIFSALLCFTIVRQEATDSRALFVSGWTLATRVGLA